MTRIYVDMVADLFHCGHVEFLRQARAMGDELVVGIHSDDTVEQYKRRPIMTLEERVAVVTGCRYVDEVVADAPLVVDRAWLERHNVDLVVHGDDLDDELMLRLYRVPMEMGIFRTVACTPGISTTDLLSRLRSAGGPEARTDASEYACGSPRLASTIGQTEGTSPGRGAGARPAFKAVARRLFRIPVFGRLLEHFKDSLYHLAYLRLPLGGADARRMSRIPLLGRPLTWVNDRLFAHQFVADLRRLHDGLAGTELAGRYWVWAGILLGWAREGHLLAHDRDADFALLDEDVPRLLSAVPALGRAGFEPFLRFRNNEGRVTGYTFSRHRTKFEFIVFEPVDGMLRYYSYGVPPRPLIEVEARVPDQELVAFNFLGRTWLRHADYERELESIYGDWRTPQRDWDYLQDDQAAVCHRPWVNPDMSWE